MSLRILLIERDQILSDLLKFWIRLDGYDVLNVSDEATCHQIASTSPFDLIIVDVDSLGTGGIDLIANLRDVQPGASILAIVPFGKDDIIALACQRGADYSMGKPLNVASLREYLSTTIRYSRNTGMSL